MVQTSASRGTTRAAFRALLSVLLLAIGWQMVYAQSPFTQQAERCGTPAGASFLPRQMTESTITLKIFLVQFADVRCATENDGITPRYTARDFEDMLGSEGVYVSPQVYSPDGDVVYGSMNDYYRAMSGGRLRVHARVINRVDSAGRPVWVTLPMTKTEYQESGVAIFSDATDAAEWAGIDYTMSDTSKLAIIYAGNTYFQLGGLNPMAMGFAYIMSEVQGRPYGYEHPDAKFARIGIHCHEFGHTIDIGHTTGGRADLMCGGTSNGSVEGNAPASLNAIVRARLGWANVIPVQGTDPVQVDLPYSLSNPTVYVVKNSAGDQFYFENRRFDQTMTIGTTVVPDYNNVAFYPPAGPHHAITQGIFVWRVSTIGDSRDPGYSTQGLIYASGRYGRTFPENGPSDTDDGDPFPGVSGTRVLSPWSDPRDPYIKEMDCFGSGSWHYTLFVPNTKGGSTGGMEILSEDDAAGKFTVRLYPGVMPNPALANFPAADTMGAYDARRTALADSSGAMHQVMEVGGEVFYRRSAGRTWGASVLLSQGNGGNSVASLARSGGAILAGWQMDAYDAADSGRGIYVRRSTDDGSTWAPSANVGWSYRCGAPGAFPLLAGAADGSAALVYRSDGSPLSMFSRDAGVSWSIPFSVPVTGVECSSMVLACGGASGPREGALLAFRTSAPGAAAIGLADYSFVEGSWTCVRTLPVPPVFTASQNPDIVRDFDASSPAGRIRFDATDSFGGGRPVVLSCAAGSASPVNHFSARRGAVQNDFTFAQCAAGDMFGAERAPRSRLAALWDTVSGAALTLELGAVTVRHRSGVWDTLPPPVLSGSIVPADPCSLFSAAGSAAFAIASDIDSISVLVSLWARQAVRLLAADTGGVEVDVVGDAGVHGTLTCATFPLPLPVDGQRGSWRITLPASRLSSAGAQGPLFLRPVVRGVRALYTIACALCDINGESSSGTPVVLAVNAGDRSRTPSGFALSQNYPNPFNPSTTVTYRLPQNTHVTLTVYTLLGQAVATLIDGVESAGVHAVRFDARDLASGTYVCRIQAGGNAAAVKMLLIR